MLTFAALTSRNVTFYTKTLKGTKPGFVVDGTVTTGGKRGVNGEGRRLDFEWRTQILHMGDTVCKLYS